MAGVWRGSRLSGGTRDIDWRQQSGFGLPHEMQTDFQGRNGFLFSVNLVFLSQIAIYGFAFGLRVVLAQRLGDDGLGTYSLFFVAVLVAGGVANLGVGLATSFPEQGTYEYGTLPEQPGGAGWSVLAGWGLLGLWALLVEPELFGDGVLAAGGALTGRVHAADLVPARSTGSWR
jgi:hypothetical protein